MRTLIGKTPIIQLESGHPKVNLYAKCEFLNPTASIKDRVAAYILEHARSQGLLQHQQLIVEASSGNMGASLAAIGRQYGHPVHITCPQKTGNIKRNIIEKLGATLTICPNLTDKNDPRFYVNQARSIAKEKKGFLVNQYDSLLNRECHYMTTGQEIVDDFIEKKKTLDYFITVGGSGGTVTGCAHRIKEYFPQTRVVMPDPIGSVYHDLFYCKKIIPENIRCYRVEGPGNPTFCQAMDLSFIDQVMQFSDEEAIEACDLLARKFGLLVGHSAGANYHIAQKIIHALDIQKSINILILLPDSGIKYLCI